MAYIPTLSDMIGPTETKNTTPAYTPTLQDMVGTSTPESSVMDNATSTLQAQGAGVRAGLLDATGDMATLAKNILERGISSFTPKMVSESINKGLEKVSDAVGSKYGDLKKSVAQTENQQSIKEHPIAYGIGGAAGYVGGMSAESAPAANALGDVANRAVSKVLPLTGGSPVVRGAVQQGLSGAMQGVAANPEHPVIGGVVGGVTGGVVGAKTGPLQYELKRSSDIINRTINNAVDLGESPGSHTTLFKIQDELKSEGLQLRQLDLKAQMKEAVNDKLNAIRPDKYDPKGISPITMLGEKAKQDFTGVNEQRIANYKPINDAPQPFIPQNFNDTLKTVGDSLKKGLPKTSVDMQTPTLQSMLNYRQLIDGKINQVENAHRIGQASLEDVIPYQKLRNALDTDIKTSAAQIPYVTPNTKTMADQLNIAEDHWNKEYRPFQIYDKDLKQYNIDPTEINKTMQDIGQALNVRLVPKFDKLAKIAQTLGPDGKDLVGWASIETLYRKSLTGTGILKPNTLDTGVTRMKATGMYDMLSQDQKQALDGIAKVVQEGNEMLKQAAPKISETALQQGLPSSLSHPLASLMNSRTGIDLLKTLGSSSTSPATARSIIQHLLTSTLSIGASKMTNLALPPSEKQQ